MTRTRSVRPFLPIAVALPILAAAAPAQCTQWSAVGTGTNNTVLALTSFADGGIAAGGVFTQAGGTPVNRIARWNGSAWTALGSGLDASVRALTTLPNGDLVAAGDFAQAGGTAASRIARWDGTAWTPLGTGISSATAFGLYAVTTMPNGDVVAGGYFTSAGGVPANAIARWNGSSWAPLGSGILATVFALAVAPNGDLLAGGNFSTAGGVAAPRIARWNGSSWSGLGSGLAGFRVNAIATLANGDIVVGGHITSAGGQPANRIARWNGSSWSAMGSGMDGDVLALSVLPDGSLLAGGQFTTAGGVAAPGCARWNGSTWSAVGFGSGAQVYALTAPAAGERIAGGFFGTVGGVGAAFLARYGSTCPATAVDSAAGCTGAAGSPTCTATTLPWVGTTYRTQGQGLPTQALVGAVSSLATASQPLSAFQLPAPAACHLWVAPDAVSLLVPTAGVVHTALALPDQAAFVGLQLHQQLLVLDLDAGGQLREATASNRLTATIGRF